MMKKTLKPALLLVLTLCLSAAYAQEPQYGQASFYDDSFHGSETAYGVKYDKNELTAAHKIHPFGTILKVTRLDNKRSVNVKVTDKGPYLKGRVIDLSRRAAEVLGMINDGVVEVKVEVVQSARPATSVAETAPKPSPKPPALETAPAAYDNATPPPARSTTTTTPATEAKKATATAAKDTPKATTKTNTPSQEASAKLVGKDYVPYDLYQIKLLRPAKKGYGVQVASFVTYENVLRQVADLQAKSFDNILVSVEKGKDNKPMYKIILGNFANEAQASNYRNNLKRKYKINGFVVDLGATQY
ncbi:MAG TPA: septal ring lytic transglycosylase RlpA family protein [Saprospiraceae bacterium]|nr:septal ring lytic transglycosylase RlpA family protein [Saprospiraceae bacterium]HMP26148.1 septal ring lytic transglycosylase RlpA family protein [Saprospiraceae bacterium]